MCVHADEAVVVVGTIPELHAELVLAAVAGRKPRRAAAKAALGLMHVVDPGHNMVVVDAGAAKMRAVVASTAAAAAFDDIEVLEPAHRSFPRHPSACERVLWPVCVSATSSAASISEEQPSTCASSSLCFRGDA